MRPGLGQPALEVRPGGVIPVAQQEPVLRYVPGLFAAAWCARRRSWPRWCRHAWRGLRPPGGCSRGPWWQPPAACPARAGAGTVRAASSGTPASRRALHEVALVQWLAGPVARDSRGKLALAAMFTLRLLFRVARGRGRRAAGGRRVCTAKSVRCGNGAWATTASRRPVSSGRTCPVPSWSRILRSSRKQQRAHRPRRCGSSCFPQRLHVRPWVIPAQPVQICAPSALAWGAGARGSGRGGGWPAGRSAGRHGPRAS